MTHLNVLDRVISHLICFCELFHTWIRYCYGIIARGKFFYIPGTACPIIEELW
jgi:hypothetical protein